MSDNQNVIELSIDESNALRISLGLKPLRLASNTNRSSHGNTTTTISIASGNNAAAAAPKTTTITARKNSSSLPPPQLFRSDHNLSLLLPAGSTTILTLGDTCILPGGDKNTNDNQEDDDKNGSGNNDNDEAILLTNANLDEYARTKKNLKRKQKILLGSGRAGGYAGYDDDEFENYYNDNNEYTNDYNDLQMVESGNDDDNDDDHGGKRTRGMKGGGSFTIDADGKISYNTTNNDGGGGSSSGSMFGGKKGSGAISLQSRHSNKIASDYLSHHDEDEADGNKLGGEDKLLEKERRKQIKLLEKLRRRAAKKSEETKKKNERSRRRAYDSDDDENDENNEGDENNKGANEVKGGDNDNGERNVHGEKIVQIGGDGGGRGSLLAMLEATAVGTVTHGEKRRRREADERDENNNSSTTRMNIDCDKRADATTGTTTIAMEEDYDVITNRRKRFDVIMEKGKARSERAFNRSTATISKRASSKAQGADDDVDNDDDDDAFLNAALAKARRLKRLKELNSNHSNNITSSKDGDGGAKSMAGENAVVAAVERLRRQEEEEAAAAVGSSMNEDGTRITFEFDEVREFTRALRARENSTSARTKHPQQRGISITSSKAAALKENILATEKEDGKAAAADTTSELKPSNDTAMLEEVVDTNNMQELAKEIENDVDDNEIDDMNETMESTLFGSTAVSAPVGRGMSNFLSLLRNTGEIKDHSTKEEMRGRAKDKRTYEDYERLDLEKVVQIDDRRPGVHERDLELARREIKLEYRDEHGRLLTRKEAYRNMCYQFHGHGSSKKNQERRLKQIERERAEYSKSSTTSGGSSGGESRGVGTLGALKATQKATGKAFIIHKT